MENHNLQDREASQAGPNIAMDEVKVEMSAPKDEGKSAGTSEQSKTYDAHFRFASSAWAAKMCDYKVTLDLSTVLDSQATLNALAYRIFANCQAWPRFATSKAVHADESRHCYFAVRTRANEALGIKLRHDRVWYQSGWSTIQDMMDQHFRSKSFYICVPTVTNRQYQKGKGHRHQRLEIAQDEAALSGTKEDHEGSGQLGTAALSGKFEDAEQDCVMGGCEEDEDMEDGEFFPSDSEGPDDEYVYDGMK